MSEFLLVHGAWHGAWCWRRLQPMLHQAGHRTLTPTLTGQGSTSHLAGPWVGLSTHVQDVTNAILSEELEDVLLVGHSYAGIVITLVACQIPHRIARMVYVDSFVPSPGKSLFDLIDPQERTHLRSIAAGGPKPWLLPPFPPAGYGVFEPDDAKWLERQLTPMTLACFEEPALFDEARVSLIPRTYIRATKSDRDRFEKFAAPFRGLGATDYYEVPSGHDMMITHATETARILLQLAEQPATQVMKPTTAI